MRYTRYMDGVLKIQVEGRERGMGSGPDERPRIEAWRTLFACMCMLACARVCEKYAIADVVRSSCL